MSARAARGAPRAAAARSNPGQRGSGLRKRRQAEVSTSSSEDGEEEDEEEMSRSLASDSQASGSERAPSSEEEEEEEEEDDVRGRNGDRGRPSARGEDEGQEMIEEEGDVSLRQMKRKYRRKPPSRKTTKWRKLGGEERELVVGEGGVIWESIRPLLPLLPPAQRTSLTRSLTRALRQLDEELEEVMVPPVLALPASRPGRPGLGMRGVDASLIGWAEGLEGEGGLEGDITALEGMLLPEAQQALELEQQIEEQSRLLEEDRQRLADFQTRAASAAKRNQKLEANRLHPLLRLANSRPERPIPDGVTYQDMAEQKLKRDPPAGTRWDGAEVELNEGADYDPLGDPALKRLTASLIPHLATLDSRTSNTTSGVERVSERALLGVSTLRQLMTALGRPAEV